MFVVDACVALKWFLQEKDTQTAIKFLDKTRKEKLRIIVPHIFFFEVVNAIKTKSKSTPEQVRKVIKKLFYLNLERQKTNLALFEKINFYAQKYDLTIYDASYIATAKINNAIFVTADEKMAQKANLKFIKILKEMKEK